MKGLRAPWGSQAAPKRSGTTNRSATKSRSAPAFTERVSRVLVRSLGSPSKKFTLPVSGVSSSASLQLSQVRSSATVQGGAGRHAAPAPKPWGNRRVPLIVGGRSGNEVTPLEVPLARLEKSECSAPW